MSKHIFKGIVIVLIAMVVTVFAAVPILAAELCSGDTVTIASEEVVDEDLYITGGNIIVDGTINGDLIVMGGTIAVNGTVNGDLVAAGGRIVVNGTVLDSIMVAGGTVEINGEVTRTVRAAGGTLNISGNVGGDLVVAGGEVNVARTATIGGDLVFGAGTIRIDSLINGDIKGGGGEVTLTNGVGGDIELGVDQLIIASTANIQGNLTYVSKNEANIQSGAQIGGITTRKVPEVREPVVPKPGIWVKVIAFLMTLLAGIVIIVITPKRAAAVATSIRHKPWLSLGWGAIILFATPIAAIITFITVIGAPVGLIGLTLYGIAIYLSQIAIGLFIGYWIIGSFSKVESRGVLIGALALGFAILTLLKLIPYVGFVMWLATALFGIGAMALSGKMQRAEA